MKTLTVTPWGHLLRSSIGRKFLVAGSAAFLVLFMAAHTVGNLQIFLGPDQLNHYAWFLHSLPYGLVWVFRALVLVALVVHIGLAAMLHGENQRRRGRGYLTEGYLSTSRAGLSMMITGTGLLLFLIWHVLHFTLQATIDYSMLHTYELPGVGVPVTNVYGMLYIAFSNPWMSLMYVVATGLVAVHMSHGVASIFQSFGWRTSRLKPIQERISRGFGLFVFVGLGSIPVAVLADSWLALGIFDTSSFAQYLR